MTGDLDLLMTSWKRKFDKINSAARSWKWTQNKTNPTETQKKRRAGNLESLREWGENKKEKTNQKDILT